MNRDKIKCYIYTCVSTAIQVDGYSLDAQRETMRKYADFQNMEIVREYSDEGHSGKNIRGRQELVRMLNDIEDGKDEVSFVLVRAQILDLKKSSISADSIYEFLLHFDEIYRECTDAEKKKFMQSFVDRIELYPERRKDGNWIKNILFNFSIPVVRDDEEIARIGGISMENSTLSNVDSPLEKLPTHETVVLLSHE